MAKIIKLNGEKILIGTDDGKIKEVRAIDVAFAPAIGDEVEIFEDEGNTIITKKEQKKEKSIDSGININVSNNQNGIQPAYVAYNSKAVNKVVYCLLAFFLGGIGAHKFYAGKISAGILYIFFCWTGIPLIISIIELLVALCKRSDANGNILV